jgi:ligand-binding sensor domain-containing protein
VLKLKHTLYLLLLCFNFAASQNNAGNIVLYSLTEKDGLTDNSVNTFFEDSRGVMWLGTNYGLNTVDGSVIKNFLSKNGCGNCLANDVVNDIKEDGDKNLWIATANGLSMYNLQAKIFTNYFFNSNDEALNRFYSVSLVDTVLLLSTEKGLIKFSIITKQFTLIQNPDNSAGSNRIGKIFTDSKKRIWLGTSNGLWQFNLKTNKFINVQSPANDMLFDGFITDIFESHDGQIYFGTWSKGLKKINTETKKLPLTCLMRAAIQTCFLLLNKKHPQVTPFWQATT